MRDSGSPENPVSVPRHVAIIMDGNGRWAQQRGLARTKGHEAGAESVREVVRACARHGVEVLTLYSFSTENWARPPDEVAALMGLLTRYLGEELAELHRNRVRLLAIGDIDRLPLAARTLLAATRAATATNDGLRLVLALSYGGRGEIARAVRALARDVRDGALSPDDIDESALAARLDTAGLPDPDLLVRTSGEMRLSNFLLWQAAYAEIYVTDVLWPDFREPHLLEAFRAYGKRSRRFGRTQSQVEASP